MVKHGSVITESINGNYIYCSGPLIREFHTNIKEKRDEETLV